MKITIESGPGEAAPSVTQAAPVTAAEPDALFSAALAFVQSVGSIAAAIAFLHANGAQLDVVANPSNTEPADRGELGLSRFCGFAIR